MAMISAGNEESVRVDLTSGRFSMHELKLSQANHASTISPDGKSLVIASSMRYAKIFDAATYREMTTLSGFMFGVHGVAYSPDQQRLAIASAAFEALTLWDVHNYYRLLTLPLPADLGNMKFSPDGNVIVGGSGDTGAAFLAHPRGRRLRRRRLRPRRPRNEWHAFSSARNTF